MKQHHFTVQHGDFTAELILGGEWSLYDFAEFIVETLDFDFDHAFEFCDNLRNPYRSKIRYSLFADMSEGEGEPGVKNTMVSTVFKPKTQMLFHFDYGDDWFFLIKCTEVTESEKARRFRKVVSTKGEPPEQYPDEEE